MHKKVLHEHIYKLPRKTVVKIVGKIAIERVINTRCQRFHFKFKKPSIANCPEYVPVIVDDCPAANKPIAQMKRQARPNSQPRNIPLMIRLV